MIVRLVAHFGVLRSVLMASIVALIVIAPFTGGPLEVHGWSIVTTLLAPTLFVVMVFVLPLEITMSVIFMSDKTGEARRRLKRIVVIEALLFAGMLLAWLPLVLKLLRIR